ncbi:hypothetical protein A3709_18675 [Halioglobus sp. HI00S01]|uniref:hypothetical protein n=1 Tax=Halioglobus sp. HI00S01 TaxID=1822214 RepID=UPI0007C40AB0|nr:hypothetical protein [Halioglobus sp. HI00S01]KZX58098.1 hypothetical protein A3709_18675 [Halioglobus sp. HI00S01]
MKLNFLCAHHRTWLQGHPEVALSTCITSYEQGINLIEDNNFRAAANHAGCALEAAQIVLGQQVPDADHVGRFSDAGVLLVYALQLLGEDETATKVHGGVLSYLERKVQAYGSRSGLVEALQRWMKLADEMAVYAPPVQPQVASMLLH